MGSLNQNCGERCRVVLDDGEAPFWFAFAVLAGERGGVDALSLEAALDFYHCGDVLAGRDHGCAPESLSEDSGAHPGVVLEVVVVDDSAPEQELGS